MQLDYRCNERGPVGLLRRRETRQRRRGGRRRDAVDGRLHARLLSLQGRLVRDREIYNQEAASRCSSIFEELRHLLLELLHLLGVRDVLGRRSSLGGAAGLDREPQLKRMHTGCKGM